jgi:hypothetical protein
MANYPSEHGDVFILGDSTRQQLATNIHGVNFSFQPSTWYMVSSAQTIYKGYAVAVQTTPTNTVAIADSNSVTAIIGIAMNTVAATTPITLTGTLATGSYTITGTGSTAALNTMLTSGPVLVTGTGVPVNTVVGSVDSSSQVTLSNAMTVTGSQTLTFGLAIEVASEGPYNFASTAFNTSDIGLPLYLYPAAASTYTASGTLGSNPQLTTSRSLAASSGSPLIEVGVVTSISSMIIDLQGDVRGATGLTQITANAGEVIPNTAAPVVVSMGSDGLIYTADRRKSYNNVQPKVLITNNACGVGLTQIQVQSTVITFSVLTGASAGGTLTWSGSASGTVTVAASDTAAQVAYKMTQSLPTGWTVSAQGTAVTMTVLTAVAVPSLAVASTGVTISALSLQYSYAAQTQITVTAIAGTSNTVNIAGVVVSLNPAVQTTTILTATAIANAFSGNISWTATSSTSTVTLTPIATVNRNTPIGFLVGANTGYANTYSTNSGTIGISTIKKVLWVAELGLFVALGSSSTYAYWSTDAVTWNQVSLPASKNWVDVTWSPSIGRLVAIATSDTQAATSPDGKVWTTMSMPSAAAWVAVKWCASLTKFVAICSGSTTTAYSSTGLTGWTPTTNIASATWTSLDWSPDSGRLVAIASGSATSSYSTDGITWNAGGTGMPAGGGTSVKYSSTLKLFVAVNPAVNVGTGTSMSSVDGVNWAQSSSLPAAGASSNWSTLEWCPDRNIFVAIASNTTTATAAYSSDGKTWVSFTPTNLNASTWTTMSWSPTLQLFSVIAQSATTRTIYFGGQIIAQTPVVIQKVGVTTSAAWSGLSTGSPVYADINGGFTTNLATLSYYSDIASPLGYVESPSSIYVNISYNTQKSDGNQIGSIIAKPASLDTGYLTCDGSTPNISSYPDLFNVIGTTFGGNGTTTFGLPPTSTPATEIKYSNWYQSNPPQAPSFRYDTGWTTWGALPSGCTSGTPTQYIEVPITTFSYNPDFTSLFAEIYVYKGASIYKIDPNPITITYNSGLSYKRYGYQLQSDTTGYVRVNFADDGLAYYLYGQSPPANYVAIDNTWQFRVIIYKTERYNKYFDYNMDQKMNQVWSLGLVDFTAAYNVQVSGYFDRSASSPAHNTVRLNYDGELYFYDGFATNNLTVGTNTTGALTIYSSMTSTSSTANILINTATINIGTTSTTAIYIGNGSSANTLTGTTTVPGGSTLTIAGTFNVNTATILTNQSTMNIFTATASTINIGSTAGSTVTNISGINTGTMFNLKSTSGQIGFGEIASANILYSANSSNSASLQLTFAGYSGNAGTFEFVGYLSINTAPNVSYDLATNANVLIGGTLQISSSGTLQYNQSSPSGTAILGYNGYLYTTKSFNAIWNDIAEFMEREGITEAGDVLIVSDKGVRKSDKRACKAVIGIHSDTFGYALGAQDMEDKTPVGLTGRVKVKVKEPLKIGDLLVSDKEGFATRAMFFDRLIPGVIIGKVVQTKKDFSVDRIWALIINR